MRAGACSKCGRSLVWAVTRTGAKMPLDIDSAHGDFVLPAFSDEANLPVVRRRIAFSENEELQRYRFHVCAGQPAVLTAA